MPTADVIRHTASSEYSARNMRVDTLQIHHGTVFDVETLISLMQPGGRTVSANYALDTDGTLYEVVPPNMRAFTSASAYDHRSITVETVNTSGDPDWGISEASHRRLARLADEMFAEGILGAITRQYIIGHYEVPGSYATACPGPSMNLNYITSLAQGGGQAEGGDEMAATYFLIQDDGAKAALGVKAGDYVIRPYGGAPLMYLPPAHAQEALLADGIVSDAGYTPAAKYRHFGQSGDWLIRAVADDNANFAVNAKMHPFLLSVPGTGGGSWPSDYAKEATVVGVGQKVDNIKVQPTKATVSLS